MRKLSRNTTRAIVFIVLALVIGIGIGYAIGSSKESQIRVIQPVSI